MLDFRITRGVDVYNIEISPRSKGRGGVRVRVMRQAVDMRWRAWADLSRVRTGREASDYTGVDPRDAYGELWYAIAPHWSR